ncbi:MAG: hypothetical protein GX774_04645 [Armatimonadetes bacterium]|jgi:anaerobic sulfite reductase subunit C|nr:hypothetical protein [Armatimonadota bacterium]
MSAPPERAVGLPQGAAEQGRERFAVRLRAPTGMLSADQLLTLSEVAREYGLGYVQLAARQGVEIPGVSFGDLPVLQQTLTAAGLPTGSPGAHPQNVVVCTGQEKCAHCFVDARGLASMLDLLLGGEEYPSPVRIAIAACSSGCTAPQLADIGFVGTVDPVLDRAACNGCGRCAGICDERALTMRRGLPRRDPLRCDNCGACIAACELHALRPGRVGYTVYVGGHGGRRPQFGTVLARFLPEREAAGIALRILSFLRDRGQPRERLGALVQRLGLDALRAHVHSRLLLRMGIEET